MGLKLIMWRVEVSVKVSDKKLALGVVSVQFEVSTGVLVLILIGALVMY